MTPATDWKEVIPEDEAARFERYAEQLRELQRKNARGGPASRALHAKGVGVEAELTVLADLPEHGRVGLFASPGTYRALVRFSNGAPVRQHDAKGDVRAMAIKVMGVSGKKIIPGMESATTQDFLLNRSPSVPFRHPDEFVWLVLAATRPATLLPRMIGHFGFGRAFSILRQFTRGMSAPMPSVATSRYFSQVAIRFGPYAVRCAVTPHAQAPEGAKRGRSQHYLAEDLAARLAEGPLQWDFRVQHFVDETRTPIEDASREWREEDAPFLTVGRVVLPPQKLASPRGQRVAEYVEKLSFDPWHALEEHRPLGSMMRARNHAYRLSTQERGAAPEPDGTERFD
jgi:hypothetical protein